MWRFAVSELGLLPPEFFVDPRLGILGFVRRWLLIAVCNGLLHDGYQRGTEKGPKRDRKGDRKGTEKGTEKGPKRDRNGDRKGDRKGDRHVSVKRLGAPLCSPDQTFLFAYLFLGNESGGP